MRSDRVFNGRDDARGFLSARKSLRVVRLTFPKGRKPSGVKISSKNTIQEIDASVRGWIKRVYFLMRAWMRRIERSFGAFASFCSHHSGARAFLDFGRFSSSPLYFWTFYSPKRSFSPFIITAHGQDDHPRSRVFGHHRQRQGENPRQRGHPAGSAAIDLRRKTIRRWPNFSRL